MCSLLQSMYTHVCFFGTETVNQKMQSTTRFEPNPTRTQQGSLPIQSDPLLLKQYEQLTKDAKISWTGHHHMLRLLGRGGQGEVYLTEYRGTDGFTVPVAMKVFSPERYAGSRAYNEAMQRIASIAEPSCCTLAGPTSEALTASN